MNTNAILHRIHDEVPGVEKVVWILDGAKRCSSAPEGIEAFQDELSRLRIKVVQDAVAARDWPAEAYFLKRFSPGTHSRDGSCGLYFDIPYCCATAFQETMEGLWARAEEEQPFRRREAAESLDTYYDERNEYLAKRILETDIVGEKHRRAVDEVLHGIVAESSFFLLDYYLPCTPVCARFVRQATAMHRALEKRLPRQSDGILAAYKARALEW